MQEEKKCKVFLVKTDWKGSSPITIPLNVNSYKLIQKRTLLKISINGGGK